VARAAVAAAAARMEEGAAVVHQVAAVVVLVAVAAVVHRVAAGVVHEAAANRVEAVAVHEEDVVWKEGGVAVGWEVQPVAMVVYVAVVLVGSLVVVAQSEGGGAVLEVREAVAMLVTGRVVVAVVQALLAVDR
jgi:hypothetical protein